MVEQLHSCSSCKNEYLPDRCQFIFTHHGTHTWWKVHNEYRHCGVCVTRHWDISVDRVLVTSLCEVCPNFARCVTIDTQDAE